MEQLIEREGLIKKYLLGELAGAEQTKVEIRLLRDQEYFDELLLVEEEITDDFLFGTLPNDERERARTHFLSIPDRRKELRFSRVLERYASSSSAVLEEHAPAFTATDQPGTLGETTLAESQRNRALLGSLINGDWMGLHLLVLLRSESRRASELASRVNADETATSLILDKLKRAAVVEKDGELFCCTELGLEILGKIEETSQLRFTP